MHSLDGVLAGVRDGTLAAGLVRSTTDDTLEVHRVRRLRQGALLPADDPLATESTLPVSALADRPILLHARTENPGHYDEIVALCRRAGFEPSVIERTVSFDPTQADVRRGTAVAIQADTGDGLRLPDLRWIPFDPPQWFEVQLVVVPPPRPAAVDRVVDAIRTVSRERSWLVH